MRSSIKKIIAFVGAFSIMLASLNVYASSKPEEAKPPQPTKNVQKFIDYMVKVHHFNREELTRLLSRVKYNQQVIDKISNPYEAQPWYIYRAHFLTNERIQNGVLYWKKHEKPLAYAQKKYGVPASIVIAIIGVETHYGKHVGDYQAINALSTLAFRYPKRSHYFTKELTQFLLLTKEQKFPPFSVKSSYAGAIGIPQFMPSAYRHYAVGYANKKHANIMEVDADAIVSVANYFHLNGWQRNHPIASPLTHTKPINPNLISKKTPRLRKTIAQLKKMGIAPVNPIPNNEKAAVLALDTKNGKEYWLVFHNFKVIMRYNPSIAYAMAVYQLSKAIQKIHDQQTPGASPTTTSARKASRGAR